MAKMDRELFKRWEHIVDDVDKTKIPITFVKKLVVKLIGKKQKTINIQVLERQGLDEEQIEDVVSRQLSDLDESITSIDFILDVEKIALSVQPETDKLLDKL